MSGAAREEGVSDVVATPKSVLTQHACAAAVTCAVGQVLDEIASPAMAERGVATTGVHVSDDNVLDVQALRDVEQ